MQISPFSLRTLVAIVAITLAGGALAQDGQTVFKDPVTGKMRNPTAAEAKELSDLRAADRAAAKAQRKAAGAPMANVARLQNNGIVAAFVDEESISYSVMTKDSSGELVLQCVTGASSAANALSHPSSVTDAKEHKHEVQ